MFDDITDFDNTPPLWALSKFSSNARRIWRLAVLARKKGLNDRKFKKYLRSGRLDHYMERSLRYHGGSKPVFTYSVEDELAQLTFQPFYPLDTLPH